MNISRSVVGLAFGLGLFCSSFGQASARHHLSIHYGGQDVAESHYEDGVSSIGGSLGWELSRLVRLRAGVHHFTGTGASNEGLCWPGQSNTEELAGWIYECGLQLDVLRRGRFGVGFGGLLQLLKAEDERCYASSDGPRWGTVDTRHIAVSAYIQPWIAIVPHLLRAGCETGVIVHSEASGPIGVPGEVDLSGSYLRVLAGVEF